MKWWKELVLIAAFVMGIVSDFAPIYRAELILWQVATAVWVVAALAWRARAKP